MKHHTSLNPLLGPAGTLRLSKFIFLLFNFVFPASTIYVNSIKNSTVPANERLIQEALDISAQDPRFAEKYRVKDLFSQKLKYILLWTPQGHYPFDRYGNGQQRFIENKCEFTNCFVTPKRDYLGGDITKFDAVAINGRSIKHTTLADLPQQRSPYQKFIYFNIESSPNQPVCNPWFDSFFNWTATFKLDSDIVNSYIYISGSEGKLVGPRITMEWVKDMRDVDEEFKKRLQTKKKAAAWFVSHCITRSKREKYVTFLQKALKVYDLTVDVCGDCGTFSCPKTRIEYWNTKVETDYYFYLSFENAFAEDYVTEKLLTALNHYAVPIVYGGSNYSRFLPPGSYIDAQQHTPEELAALMTHLIATPSEYHDFFRWRNHYSYSTTIEDACNVCAALNNKEKVLTQSVYENFRSWWNPDWEERCRDDNWNT